MGKLFFNIPLAPFKGGIVERTAPFKGRIVEREVPFKE
jgi:hypothetical protein